MHICCANCGLYPVKHLSARGIDIKGLWFNPNIHPEDEYDKRLDALKTLQGLWGLDIEYHETSGPEDFFSAVENHNGLRCEACYGMRLAETAATAKKMGLDGFTTTMLVSPYQRFDMMVDIGRRLEREYSVPFFVEDLRPGWNEGVRLSKELGLYRQKYCGCVFSKAERDSQSRGPRPRELKP